MRLIFIFILSTGGFLFSQSNKSKPLSDIEVKYLYTSARDTTDLSNKIEEVMVLDFNPNSSIYFSDAFLQRRRAIETELQVAKNSGTIAEINAGKMARPKVDYSVYRNNGKTIVTSRLGQDFFSFDGEAPKWQTNYNEEKNILGYKCKKATTVFNKRKYTAWYTKEIPISEGPYRFKGLPGLILNIEDINGYDTFNAIGIEKVQREIVELQNGIPATRAEYLKKRDEFKANPYPSKIMNSSQHTNLENAIKKFNNSLER